MDRNGLTPYWTRENRWKGKGMLLLFGGRGGGGGDDGGDDGGI